MCYDRAWQYTPVILERILLSNFTPDDTDPASKPHSSLEVGQAGPSYLIMLRFSPFISRWGQTIRYLRDCFQLVLGRVRGTKLWLVCMPLFSYAQSHLSLELTVPALLMWKQVSDNPGQVSCD
jgi:hypothetical protein